MFRPCRLSLIAMAGLLLPIAAIAQAPAPANTPLSQRYASQAQKIIDAALAENKAWHKMEELCDGIGHRLSGSESLERALDWAVETLKRDGHENVRKEPVMVPKWVRGRESVEMIEPRPLSMPMLGLGGSVGTPAEGITAEVVVVKDKDELDRLGKAVAGKIVLFNCPMQQYDPATGTGYGAAVRYRGSGATWAAEYGGVGALVRSVTARSLQSPHTGAMNYRDAKVKVPTAAITVEHAEMISRLQKRGIRVVVTLKMEARDEGEAPSGNVIAELRGSEKPDEIVVIGGHIDSWDVGQGALDDGGGCVTAMEAISALRRLKMIPRRTIRVVLFTNEENGLAGGRAYAKDHADELSRHVAGIESDSGVFNPRGYSLDFEDAEQGKIALAQMTDIVSLLEPLGANHAELGGSGADIGPMRKSGVPLLGHQVDDSKYFDYHHSHADTLDKIDPRELSRNVAAMAVTAYVLADMPGKLGTAP